MPSDLSLPSETIWFCELIFGLAIAAWYVLQTVLNAVFGLGDRQLTPLPAVPGADSHRNQVAAFIMVVGFAPFDTAFAFFIGIYGIATMAVAALLLLRDPIWRASS